MAQARFRKSNPGLDHFTFGCRVGPIDGQPGRSGRSLLRRRGLVVANMAAVSTVPVGSRTDFLHGVHGEYAAIAVAAVIGVIVAGARFRSPTVEVTESTANPMSRSIH
ncbi:hypothetical protein ACWDUL_11260 [Nocardia niigatensis]